MIWCDKLKPIVKMVVVSPSVNPMKDKIMQMRGKKVMAIIMTI